MSLSQHPALASPHTKPALATGAGGIVGTLTVLWGFFHTGHLPSSVEIAAILGGLGLNGVAISGFIAHLRGWFKTIAPAYSDVLPIITKLEADVPGLGGRIAGLEAEAGSIEAKINASVEAAVHHIDPSATFLTDNVIGKIAELVKTQILGETLNRQGPPAGQTNFTAAPAPIPPFPPAIA